MAGRHREAAVRYSSRLGAANLAILAVYFVPTWGRDAVRALTSRYNGLEDPAHAAAASYFRQFLDLGLDGLVRTSHVLAGIKLVIAAGFVAYAIEFARSLVTGKEPDRETADVVLALALAGIAIWALPALALDDGALVRVYATQLLLVVGAVIVIVVERHIQEPHRALSRQTTAAVERELERRAIENLPLQEATMRTVRLLANTRTTPG
jgi:hypothetical protein